MSIQQQMPILITEPLREVLAQYNIDLKDYRPAYNGESIGLDLYNAGPDVEIPPLNDLTLVDLVLATDSMEVNITGYTPKERQKVLIQTGLHTRVPLGWGAILKERGSVTKSPLILRAGVIDPGYTGQIFVNLVNGSCETVIIKHGEKLPVQLIVLRALTDFVNVSEDEFNNQHSSSQRGTGMVGSSDT
jgi:dUTPase